MQSEQRKSLLRAFADLILRNGTLIGFIGLIVVLSILSDRFLTVSNMLNVLRQVSINAILAFGMTFVILTGGIDLSVGSVLAFTGAIAAGCMKWYGFSAFVSITLALLVGLALGLFNGVVVAYGRVAPFIATLAMMTIARGMTLVYTDGRPITGISSLEYIGGKYVRLPGFPAAFKLIGKGYFLHVPIPVWIMFALLALSWFLLKKTAYGRYVYAIGGNPQAAYLSGINVRKMLLITYGIGGLFSAIAGIILTSRLNSAQPTAGMGYELDAIAAVVLGGTSLAGGEGSILGTLLGALIIGVLNNGLNLLNVSSFYQQIVKGVVIILAVLIDRLKKT